MFLYNNIRKDKDINKFEVKYLAFYGIIHNRDVNFIIYAVGHEGYVLLQN
jgi:hypothetical protein